MFLLLGLLEFFCNSVLMQKTPMQPSKHFSSKNYLCYASFLTVAIVKLFLSVTVKYHFILYIFLYRCVYNYMVKKFSVPMKRSGHLSFSCMVNNRVVQVLE